MIPEVVGAGLRRGIPLKSITNSKDTVPLDILTFQVPGERKARNLESTQHTAYK